MSGIFTGLAIGIFFSVALQNQELPKWASPLEICFLVILFLGLLVFFYFVGMNLMPDVKEKRNFHDGFFINLFTGLAAVLLVLYNFWIKAGLLNMFIVLVLFIVFYFLTNFLSFQIPRPK